MGIKYAYLIHDENFWDYNQSQHTMSKKNYTKKNHFICLSDTRDVNLRVVWVEEGIINPDHFPMNGFPYS